MPKQDLRVPDGLYRCGTTAFGALIGDRVQSGNGPGLRGRTVQRAPPAVRADRRAAAARPPGARPRGRSSLGGPDGRGGALHLPERGDGLDGLPRGRAAADLQPQPGADGICVAGGGQRGEPQLGNDQACRPASGAGSPRTALSRAAHALPVSKRPAWPRTDPVRTAAGRTSGLPVATVTRILGRSGPALHERAHEFDRRAVVPAPVTKSTSPRIDLPVDVPWLPRSSRTEAGESD